MIWLGGLIGAIASIAISATAGVGVAWAAGDCSLTHNDAAELTIQHFMGAKYQEWNLNHSHSEAAELVERHPKWLAWSHKKLKCSDACGCKELP